LWRTADTLKELAALIGVPADKLEATVARFNEFVARGVDDDFGRGDEAYDRAFSGGAPPLYPITKAPFHAAAFGVSDLGTKGGLRTDTAARVLDKAGHVIPGLYAAGNTMAAPSGMTYPGGGNPIGTDTLTLVAVAVEAVAVAGRTGCKVAIDQVVAKQAAAIPRAAVVVKATPPSTSAAKGLHHRPKPRH